MPEIQGERPEDLAKRRNPAGGSRHRHHVVGGAGNGMTNAWKLVVGGFWTFPCVLDHCSASLVANPSDHWRSLCRHAIQPVCVA